ncbi:MAG: mannose-1-phosphate guanylyltransferase [Flavobacteriales bacterium]|nr:mannose-1-phosphate guanylyltransferase [Flavobacteriales bacterium]
MSDIFCVIMAGGVGSRFWPMSKTSRPKQFLDVLGTGETLIQHTYRRFSQICPDENFYVVTNELYADLVKEQLPFLSDHQILCEPARRNTAPCIAYANAKIENKNPNAKIIVTPADHLVTKQEDFVQCINEALKQASEEDALVTLGIKPSRPDTGYGYIQFMDGDDQVRKVKTFTEKPNLEIANKFIESGDFYWNSGIFIWSLKSINAAFEKHLTDVKELFDEGKSHYNTDTEKTFINDIYFKCQDISIDYGIMEKAEKVFVVLSDFGWSDLGTWGSLYTHLDHDQQGNTNLGNNMLYDTSGSIIQNYEEKLIVAQGLNDYIVINTKDALMICKKDDEQKIKQFVSDLKNIDPSKI